MFMGELLLDSEKRVTPECGYFGTCGGCSFQDLDYEIQLELKRRKVGEVLNSFRSGDDFEINPTIPSPKLYNYRHMIALTVKKRQEMLRLGFIGLDSTGTARRAPAFLPIEACPIARSEEH